MPTSDSADGLRTRPNGRFGSISRPLHILDNVLDISQTIIDGFFNMMMIVDYSGADNEFGVIVEDLDKLGEQIGVRIRCQREEIFTKMHRV